MNTQLLFLVKSILANKQVEIDSSEDITRSDLIEKVIPAYGWEDVQDVLIEVLKDPSYSTDVYTVIATLFWGAVLDKRSVKANEVIALVTHRLPADPGSDRNNLAWSITAKLKKVDYFSEYDPMKDPEVLSVLKELHLDK